MSFETTTTKYRGLPEKYTRTRMANLRRKEAIPNISYDLDGDGFVGGRDFIVARRFDESKKNYLTDEEREQAYQAITDGQADKYVWEAEAPLLPKPFKKLYKVDEEKIRKDKERLAQGPEVKTSTDLIQARRLQEKVDIKRKKDARDAKVAHLQKIQFKDYYRPQEYVDNPKYTATWQKHAEDRIMTRVRGGLEPGNSKINSAKLDDPGMKWIDEPPVPSKSLLVEKRTKEGLKDQ
mmetsp:Transcript_5851/g.9405  ORF Transcript_5851/g.9405 Transcript_5851/m.9405 type:complete len:236 (+) Transcript_5851:404-1111(+)